MSFTKKGFEISEDDFYRKLSNANNANYFVYLNRKITIQEPYKIPEFREEYKFITNFNRDPDNLNYSSVNGYLNFNKIYLNVGSGSRVQRSFVDGIRILISDPNGTGKNAYCTLRGPGTHTDFYTEITVPSADGPFPNNEVKISKNESFTVTC